MNEENVVTMEPVAAVDGPTDMTDIPAVADRINESLGENLVSAAAIPAQEHVAAKPERAGSEPDAQAAAICPHPTPLRETSLGGVAG